MEVLVWGLYKQRPDYQQIVKEWAILSWSAKWLFEPKIMGAVANPKQARNRCDDTVIGPLWDLLDRADMVIAHNGNKFDLRKCNARFKINGLPPPMPYQSIDTLRHAQRLFSFSSHHLDYLGQLLAHKEKIETNYKLWKRCVGMYGEGEAVSALREMYEYNQNDVLLLEEVYLELRPWINSHPNLALYIDAPEGTTLCPNCGSNNIEWRGYYYTPAGKYAAFRCECGAIGRSRFTEVPRRRTHDIGVSVAR